MKILLSAYACEPGRGSELGNGWNWALHLAMDGHIVHVLTTPRGRPAIERTRASLPETLRRSRLDFTYVDVPGWARRWFGSRSHVMYLIWQQTVLPTARGLHASHRFDLVHHVTWGSLQGGSELWRLGRPFVFGPVGGGHTAPQGFEIDFGRAWRSERFRSFVTRRVVPVAPTARAAARGAALVLATNQETVSLARKLGASRVRLFPGPGLPESFYPDRMPVRGGGAVLRLLWVGRLFPRKALSLALDAVRRSRAPVTLTVLGDGPERSRLSSELADPRLGNKVQWLGQVPWRRVREAYAVHDAFLFTSLRDSVGYQLFEAMAFGLPVITLNHHGARDLVPQGAGVKVDVKTREETVDGLANAIDRVWRDHATRVAMGEVGYEFAKSQSWPNRVKAMGLLYEQVVAPAR